MTNDPTNYARYVYRSGVVTLGKGIGSRVLSSLPEEDVFIDDQTNPSELLGVWTQSDHDEIRLCLKTHGVNWLEGESRPLIKNIEAFRHLDPIQDRRLIQYINSSYYYLISARVQLASLLRCYAKLTTVRGPKIPFDRKKVHVMFNVPSPECYAHFDACLVALRAFADSIRFTTWNVLGRGTGIPRNLASLANTQLPEKLEEIIDQYVATTLGDILRYRDNALHYAPLAVRDNTRLIFSNDIIHAEVWLPHNPEARSHDGFEYKEQKDAYTTAKTLFEQTLEFADDFHETLGSLRDDVKSS